MAGQLIKKLDYTFEPIGKDKVEEVEPFINFLFIVHNEVEMSEMQKSLKPLHGFGVILDYLEEECMQHFFIGKFFKYNIVLAKTSDMGGRNVNSVINVINKAIQVFRPRYIIMPGIAAGLDDNLNIGDVIIADKIIGYESEKIAPAEIIGRYPEFRSPRLFNLFCSANVQTFNLFLQSEIQREINNELDEPETAADCIINCPKDKEKEFSWNAFIKNSCFPKVYTGNFISGEKLLDNSTYRSYLKARFKETAALDMEGAGVASASTFNRVYDWLVIKGISDLGDGNKGENKTLRQVYAMKNVILVLKKVFDNELSFPESTLKQVKGFSRKNVLISSSQCENGENFNVTPTFIEELSKQLIINQFNVITGYGLGVGPSALFGIFEGCDQLRLSSHEYMDRFQCFAFPRGEFEDPESKEKLEKCKVKNREILCANAKIAIFVFGNKKGKDVADGMLKELDFATENNALILPVGCTGGTARKIYQKVINDTEYYFKRYFTDRNKYSAISENVEDDLINYLKKLRVLNEVIIEETNIDEIVKKIIELIKIYG